MNESRWKIAEQDPQTFLLELADIQYKVHRIKRNN